MGLVGQAFLPVLFSLLCKNPGQAGMPVLLVRAEL